MPSKRQQLADRRSRVGESATPVNVTTDHLTAVERPPVDDGSSEDVVAYWISGRLASSARKFWATL